MNRNELINYIILNSKISLEDIAQNIGVNRSNIYVWRTNKTTPKIEYVNKMANLAGITLKWINQDEIIIDNVDSDNIEMKDDSSKDKIIFLQDETIKLQKEKISVLEQRLANRESTIGFFGYGSFGILRYIISHFLFSTIPKKTIWFSILIH